jgi:hypothetical protein
MNTIRVGHQHFTSVILTWEAESGRITVQGQLGQNVHKILSQPVDGYGFMPVIQLCASHPKLIGRLRLGELWFQASLSKKVHKITSVEKKVGHGGIHLSPQLLEEV